MSLLDIPQSKEKLAQYRPANFMETIMEISRTNALVINAPEFFEDPAFVDWLNSAQPKFTWHDGGTPSENSDVVVLVDPSLSGEGSDSDMPEHIWNLLVQACKDHFRPTVQVTDHIMVWIKNL